MNRLLFEFLHRAYKVILSYTIMAVLFLGFRIVYTIRFGDYIILSKYPNDLVHAFGLGFKYDAKVISYSLLIIVILNLIQFFIKSKKANFLIDRISAYWIIFSGTLLCLILITDHQFYTFFQSHLNILVFGLFEDDTNAVLKSVWLEHPIIKVSILIVLLYFVIYKAISKIWRNNFSLRFLLNKSITKKWIIFSLFFILFAYGIRGNLSKEFPLQMDDSVVSENSFINKLPLNGVFTLIDAVSNYTESLKPITKGEVLESHGYKSEAELLSEYFDRPPHEFIGPDYEKYLFKTTKVDSSLEKNPYNVVFILMESLGSYYLNFHSDSLNLLGEFEKHLKDVYWFKNFLSSTRGTIFSLEDILINKIWPPVSNSALRFKTFNSSVAFPFQKAGYETIFISGGKIKWRNLDEFLPNQYFSQVYGQNLIMKRHKEASANEWGVYDEYLFDEIYDQLTSNPNTPKLICALTTTNHTPYKLPKKYHNYPIIMPDSVKDIIIDHNSIAEKSFMSYQYSNDCLGRFLSKLKNSQLGNNTIVAITGDHNSYFLFPYDASGIEEINKHKVPFYLYIPDALRKDIYKSYTKRYGSHKDIFTTLFNLTLSNKRYFSLGNDLFSNTIPDSLFYSINESFFVGNMDLSRKTLQKKVFSRAFLIEYYFANSKTNANRK